MPLEVKTFPQSTALYMVFTILHDTMCWVDSQEFQEKQTVNLGGKGAFILPVFSKEKANKKLSLREKGPCQWLRAVLYCSQQHIAVAHGYGMGQIPAVPSRRRRTVSRLLVIGQSREDRGHRASGAGILFVEQGRETLGGCPGGYASFYVPQGAFFCCFFGVL